MPYVFIDSTAPCENGKIEIAGNTAHYITSVLRQKKGDNLILFNGEQEYFSAIITSVYKKKVTFQATPLTPPDVESPLHIVLCQGLLKGYKMDAVVQKATELGVKEIIPFITERSQIRYTRKMERWRKIIIEATRQSGRIHVPHVSSPVTFYHLIQSVKESGNQGVIFYEQFGEGLKSFLDLSSQKKIYLFIGPEGGFTQDEIYFAKENGLPVASFGKRILRAETAAVSAVTLTQFLYGDLNPEPQ